MLFAEFRKKRARKAQIAQEESAELSKEPSIAETNAEQTASTVPQIIPDEDEINGIELKAYARKHELSSEKVWELIRGGKLVARTENGFIYVYGSHVPEATVVPLHPEISTHQTPAEPSEETGLQVVDESASEIAMLLEHLALAKQQNLEILKMTQDSIAQIRAMSEEVVAAKNETLAEKEQVIKSQSNELSELQAKLDSERSEQARLRQELEDMQMLTKALDL